MGALRLIEEDGPGPAMRRRLAGFAHTLRGAGFALGHREVADAARLLATPLAERPERLRAALRALFCSRQNDLARFSELFDAFWLGRGAKRAAKIILVRTPGIDTTLALQIARMVAAVRKEDLRKVPGVAETLDWAATLAGLEVHDLRQEPEAVHETMICLLKTHEDRARLTREVSERLLGKVA